MFSIVIKLALALGLGAIIGLERESHREKDADQQSVERFNIGGLRTFSLIGLFGGLAGVMALHNNNVLAVIVAATFFAMLCAYYVMGSLMIKSVGVTTEISAAVAFLVGFIAVADYLPINVLVALTVVLVIVLSLKDRTKELVRGITSYEMHAFLAFAVVALVVLPFLPNRWYTIHDIAGVSRAFIEQGGVYAKLLEVQVINPFTLWLVVVLITGVQIAGHILSRIFGTKKGIIASSILGGMVSSTSVTHVLARESKKDPKNMWTYLSAAAFASAVSIPEMLFVIVLPLSRSWFLFSLATFLFAGFVGVGLALWYVKKANTSASSTHFLDTLVSGQEKIFELVPAIKFALLIISVSLLSRILLALFGWWGLCVGIIVGALAGLDSVLIVLAGMAGSVISFPVALFLFVVANASNLFGKTLYIALEGDKKLAMYFLVFSLAVICATLLGYVFA